MATNLAERPRVRVRTKSRRSTRDHDKGTPQNQVPTIRVHEDDRSPFQSQGVRYNLEAYEELEDIRSRDYALLRRPEPSIQHQRSKSAGDAQVALGRERLDRREGRRDRSDRDYNSDEPTSPVVLYQRPRDKSFEDRFGKLGVDDHAVSDCASSASDDETTPLAAFCVRCEDDLERAARSCLILDSTATKPTSQQSILEKLALSLSDQAFRLHIWASEAQVDTLLPCPHDSDEDESIELAHWTLTRLRSRTKRIAAACAGLERPAEAEAPLVTEADLDEDLSDNEVSSLP